MKTKKRIATLINLLLLAAMLAGCGSGAANTASQDGSSAAAGSQAEEAGTTGDRVVTVGFTTAWDSLNPYNSSTGSQYNYLMLDKVYDRLAYAEIDGSAFLPRGAKSWESADDNTAIVFHLDENATWSDGEPVTAEDWVFTFQRITDPDWTGATRAGSSALAGTDDSGAAVPGEALGAEALDPYTLKLTLKHPSTTEDWLLSYNRQIYVLPEHCLKDIPVAEFQTDSFWTHPVGSGPLAFVSEIVGSSMTLRARPEYQLGAPGFDTMIALVIDSSNSLNALLTGDVDFLERGSNLDNTSDAETVEAAGGTVLQMDQPTFFIEVLINSTNVTDERIRQALWYALDVDTITALMTDGYAVSTDSSVLPESRFRNREVSVDYDPDHARELLAEAEYDGTVLKLACGSSREALVSLMQQYWDAVGLNVEIQLVDVATMFSGLSDNTYDLGISGHTPTANPVWFNVASEFHVLYTGGSGTGYNAIDPKLAEYYDRIISTYDDGEKIALSQEYQAYLTESVPYIPLWFMSSLCVQSERILNIDYGASMMCNDNVWEWTLAEG